jgi:hypothetical protein
VQDVIDKYKRSNLFRKPLSKEPIAMAGQEKSNWDAEQKAKAERLAAWKAKHGKI